MLVPKGGRSFFFLRFWREFLPTNKCDWLITQTTRQPKDRFLVVFFLPKRRQLVVLVYMGELDCTDDKKEGTVGREEGEQQG